SLHPNGAFLAMVDLASGPFQFRYRADLMGFRVEAEVPVTVGDPPQPLPADDPILSLEPREDMVLAEGDQVSVRVRGPAGAEGSFEVRRACEDLPLYEVSPGLFEGFCRIASGIRLKDEPVRFQLRTRDPRRKLKAKSLGRLSTMEPDGYAVVVSTAKLTVVRSEAGGYSLFEPPGTLFNVSGRAGSRLRVSLAPGLEGWLDASSVVSLPKGTPPAYGTVGKYLNTTVSSDSVRLSVQVERSIPFEIRQHTEPLGFEVRFFGGIQRLDRFRFDPGDPVISGVRWRQEGTRTLVLEVDTRLRRGWGYDGYYEKGRFVLEIRRPPLVGDRALAGRRVVLDPGHGPDSGAWGPMGSQEQELNLALAFDLKGLLEAEGAEVFMTRTSSAGPALLERPFAAWAARGDVLVSLHNNALAVSDDPFASPRGYMTFYYHPQSRPLAEAVHSASRRLLADLPDEALRWGDLHLCRLTQMPAILTESAYVMLPEQEALLREGASRVRFAQAILEGLRGYYEEYRELQRTEAAERAAARPQ
ncbi:MAG: N-acetylmuramoyl-L-alanine amidase, partial [Elusimicrobiota bacterium]